MNEKFAQLEKIFPECFTEKNFNGVLKKVIDFDLLKDILSENISDSPESYNFSWVGKSFARAEAYKPTDKTLRPCVEKSENFFDTQNLYIEGDNLEVLKLLQQSYYQKVKMIYIDPPYNTGKDFIYRDNFVMDEDEYNEDVELFDEEGNLNFVENSESNPRFHSDWCSMIYARLLLARNLLSEDGVIFISIDDNEQANLKKICDEVFGEKNFVADILWNSTKSVTNTAIISVSHTHNLVYFKDMDYFIKNRQEFRLIDEGEGFSNPDNDPRGAWKGDNFQVGGWRPNQQYEIVNPKTGKIYKPNPGNSWKNDYEHFKLLLKDNRIVFGKEGNSGPQRKRFRFEAMARGKVATTWWDDVETTSNGTQLLKKIFDERKLFDNPKPTSLIKKMLQLATDKNSIVLDFFSGSATTAHAVMELNAEDGGARKFIMVQLPEECAENSEAYKTGYKNICEIGKERIRRAAKNISAEIDKGFRVLKLDETNFRDVYFYPEELTQEMLADCVENIKPDRTALDLLFGCLTDWGIELDKNIVEENFDGAKIYNYGEKIVACFDKNISREVIKFMAQKNISQVVFRDESFVSDAEKINAEEIFKYYSPNTKFKVI